MREHKSVSPNYRRSSTSTIVFVRRKDFKGDDAQVERCFVIKMSNLVELFGCAFCFLEEKKKKWLLRPPSRCCCYRRLWFWCCLLLLLKQIWSCNCDFCRRRSVRTFDKVIKQWFRIVVCVCSTLKCSMFDGGWTLLLNCCSQHFLFIVEILINERIRISVYDVSNIHILLCSELVNEG